MGRQYSLAERTAMKRERRSFSIATLVVICAGCASHESTSWHSIIEMDRNAWAKDDRQVAAQTNAPGIGDWETNGLQGTSAPVSAGGAGTATGVGTGSGSSAGGTAGAGTASGVSTPGVSSSSSGAGLGSSATPLGGSLSIGTGIANPGTVPGLTNVTVPQVSVPPSSTSNTNLFGPPR